MKDVEIDFETVLGILKSSTSPVGKVSGQVLKFHYPSSFSELIDHKEERDHHLGRLFGLKAVVTSGILFERGSTSGQWTEIVDLLLELAKKKPWLREECGFVIYAAIT